MTAGSMPNSLPILQTVSYFIPRTQWATGKNALVPMLDDSVRRVDYGSIHIKEDSAIDVGLWFARKGWVLL